MEKQKNPEIPLKELIPGLEEAPNLLPSVAQAFMQELELLRQGVSLDEQPT